MANCHVLFKSKTMKYVTISQNGELSRNFSIGIKKDPPFGGSFFMLAGAEGLPLLRSSRPLAGLTQARFDHRLLDSPPDCLAYADALPGSSPFHLY